MLRSMTGFASETGALAPFNWSWELRSVNGKGQDIRLRVPDWIEGLEVALRKKLVAVTARGNITMSLRINRDDTTGELQINQSQLSSVLSALFEIERRATDAGISLAPSKASDIVALRGILEASVEDDGTETLCAALLVEADTVISAFNQMRESEGAALKAVLLDQLAEVEVLTAEAAQHAEQRTVKTAESLRENLARVLENADGIEEGRIEQELALIAVKSDVTEEIDRLQAHVNAARELLDVGGVVGRKLDFLMQEFNRETNTLCSKAQSTELTRCGLALKALIDQMREQVQNVE